MIDARPISPSPEPSGPTARIVLTAGGGCLALHIDAGRLPEVVHWGAPLGEVDAESFASLLTASRPLGVHNGLPDQGYGVAIVPEQWTGFTGHPGVSGSRDGRDWAPRFVVREVLVNGEGVSGFVQVSPTGSDAAQVQVEASDEVAGLGLTLTIEMFDSGLIRQRATLTNIGDDGYQLDSLLLTLPVPARATEVLDFGGRWGKERTPQRSTLATGTHWREGRHGRAGADSAFVLHLGEPGFNFATGEVWSVHTAWSGNHVHYAERVLTGDQVIGGGELLLPGEIVLNHGDSYTSPWICLAHGVGLDAIAAQHHEFIRAAHPVSADRPVTLNTWEAVYFDHDADRLIDLAERAARVGIERFVLDDGWFGARRSDHAGLGDWIVSPDAWPQGLHPLTDAVTGLGMQFGLWFEPEMINPDSDLARAHPDWVFQLPGRTPLTSRNQWVLNIGIPQAYQHVRDHIDALLTEYPISYIKWDHNRDITDAGTLPSERPGVHEQTLAFYRLVDELKAAHPGLEIESCSSGGSRIDLEVMTHCDRVWVSDNIDPTDRQQMMRWTAQLLPPEYLGSHIASGASHTTGRHHTLDYRAATAVFGHLGVEWDLAQASDAELDRLAQWISWYKDNRQLLNSGRLVRIDLPQAPTAFFHGVVGHNRAIYALTVTESTPTWSLGSLTFPGLDPDAKYQLTELDLTTPEGRHEQGTKEPIELTGRQFATAGMRAPAMRPEHTRIWQIDRI